MALGPDAGDWFHVVLLFAMVDNRQQPTLTCVSWIQVAPANSLSGFSLRQMEEFAVHASF